MAKKHFFTVGIFFIVLNLFSSCAFNPKKQKEAEEYLYKVTTKYGTSEVPLNSAQKFVLEMGLGWNLGNTFDAYATDVSGLETQTVWGQPLTTKKMIDFIANSGIKTIRIPVSWHNHFSDNNYTIDSEWMARVKEVVDWCMEDNLYVIINCHHDDAYYTENPITYNSGFYPLQKDKTESEKFLKNVWTQVAETFKDYGEKLIFETMNEPRLRTSANEANFPCQSGNHEWGYNSNCPTCQEAARVLCEYNQLCIDTIRAAGGKNATERYISCPNLCASPDAALNYHPDYISEKKTQLEVLNDPLANHLILSIHMYTPYEFTMQNPGDTKFSESHKGTLKYYSDNLYYYYEKGFPVIIGETGATNKNNLEDRADWTAFFTQIMKATGFTCCLWDDGNSAAFGGGYGYFNRQKLSWYFPLLIDIALLGTESSEALVKNNMNQQ